MVIARARALCTAFVLHGLGTPLTKAFYVVAPKHAGGPYRTSDLSRHLVGQASRRVMGRHTAAGRVCMSSDTTTDKPVPPSMEEEVDPGVVEGTDLRVLKYPHPALRAGNEEISEFNEEVKKLVKDMFKVMYAMNGVGLAAPQVGVNKRLMVFNPEGDEKNWLDEAVLVNPRIVEFGKGKETDEEGCLSFPGMSGPVERAKWVKVEAFNAKGKKIKKKYTDYTARIFQHEYDHLDGKVYVDRLSAADREKVKPVLDKLIADYGEGGVL